MLDDLEARGINTTDKLKFGAIGDSIRIFPNADRTAELEDIRSLEDNEAVGNFFMELIRSFTANDSTRLVVSIAGGRKTTSALLHSVMTLLGRRQDSINHILINDEWIFQKNFAYPGCTGEFADRDGQPLDSADAQLQLVDVPFVPLRYLFERDLEQSSDFTTLIQRVRDRSINVGDDLTIQLHPDFCKATVSGKLITLSHNEFIVWLYFVKRAITDGTAVESYASMADELEAIKAEYLRTDDFGHWASKALVGYDPEDDIRKWVSSLRGKLKKKNFDGAEVDRLVPNAQNLRIQLPAESLSIDAMG